MGGRGGVVRTCACPAARQVFDRNPRSARHIFRSVLVESRRKERLRTLAVRLLIGLLKRGTPLWAALFVQLAWARYAGRLTGRLFRSTSLADLDDHVTEESPSLAAKAHNGGTGAATDAYLAPARGSAGVLGANERWRHARSAAQAPRAPWLAEVEARIVSVLRQEVQQALRHEFDQLRGELLAQVQTATGTPPPSVRATDATPPSAQGPAEPPSPRE